MADCVGTFASFSRYEVAELGSILKMSSEGQESKGIYIDGDLKKAALLEFYYSIALKLPKW